MDVMQIKSEEEVFALLHDILTSHPDGIKEYDLLVLLRNEGLPIFADAETRETLDLFKSHFMLFHLLYILRDRLRQEEKADITIHCLNISLALFADSKETLLPDRFDALREYYLDLDNFEGMEQEDVDRMIDDFWKRFCSLDKRAEGLAALGLEDPVSEAEIKKRYREMVFEHHPDQGGDPDEFRKVTQAVTILLG